MSSSTTTTIETAADTAGAHHHPAGDVAAVTSSGRRSWTRRRRALTVELPRRTVQGARSLAAAPTGTTSAWVRDVVRPRPHALATPPRGSGLRPVLGDADEPLVGAARRVTGDRVSWAMEKHARYGDLWWAMIAGRRMVQVTGGPGTEQVLVNADKHFSNDGWVDLIGRFFGGGLMLMSFGEHLDHRRIMQSAFTPARLRGYVEGIDRRVVAELATPTWDDGQLLAYPTLKDLGLRIATDVFLGMQLPPDQRRSVLRSFHAQARAPLALLRADVPGTLWGRGRDGYDHVRAVFRAELAAKRAGDGDDLFSALVHATDDEGARFSDDEIVDHMNFLWFAAHDTTNLAVTMMAWAFAASPAWQHRARAEALALGDGPATVDDLAALPTIDLVMREVMRLWPPVPAALRRAVVDTEIDGHWIPADTWLQVFPVATHRQERYWRRPHAFDPARFLPERAEHRAHSHCYTPFGGGVHKCIGFAFAELEARAIFRRLLATHDLSLAPGHRLDVVWSGLPEPADGMPLLVSRRR